MGLAGLLDQFEGKRLVVLGDVMLDEYVFGTIDRISPEAPVMVVRKRRSRSVPGGAANVAKNVVALGGSATVIGVVGVDDAGGRFEASLADTPGIFSRIVRSGGRPTTCKTRIVANHSHQVLRIDEETDEALLDSEKDGVLGALESALDGADGLVLSDYRKGVLSREVCSAAVGAARAKGLPVVVNGKPGSAAFFSGATVLTFNRKEATDVAASVWEGFWGLAGPEEALAVAARLRESCGVGCLVVTLGEQGLVADWEGGSTGIPAPEVEAYDVAGAGDTALAAIALGTVVGGFVPEVFRLAVEASARVVQRVGVAVPTAGDLASIRSGG